MKISTEKKEDFILDLEIISNPDLFEIMDNFEFKMLEPEGTFKVTFPSGIMVIIPNRFLLNAKDPNKQYGPVWTLKKWLHRIIVVLGQYLEEKGEKKEVYSIVNCSAKRSPGRPRKTDVNFQFKNKHK